MVGLFFGVGGGGGGRGRGVGGGETCCSHPYLRSINIGIVGVTISCLHDIT